MGVMRDVGDLLCGIRELATGYDLGRGARQTASEFSNEECERDRHGCTYGFGESTFETTAPPAATTVFIWVDTGASGAGAPAAEMTADEEGAVGATLARGRSGSRRARSGVVGRVTVVVTGADGTATIAGTDVVGSAVLGGATSAAGTVADAFRSPLVAGSTVADDTVPPDGRAAILAAAGKAFRRIVAARQFPVRATARISALATVEGSGVRTTREPADGGIR